MSPGWTVVPRRWAAAALASLVLLAGCGGGGAPSGEPTEGGRVTIAAGSPDSADFAYGQALAEVFTRSLPEVRASVAPTASSAENLRQLGAGQADVAFALADAAADAVQGREGFAQPVPAQALAQLYPEALHVVAKAGAPIRAVPDLRGKRVSIGAPDSGTQRMARRLLEAAGINPERDLRTVEQLDATQSIARMRQGALDVFFWSAGLPSLEITDYARTQRIRLLSTAEYAGALRTRHSEAYQIELVPVGTYPGVNEDVETVTVANLLVVNRAMDAQLANDLTRLLYENSEALSAATAEARKLDPAQGRLVEPLSLHPGAQRYYDGVGSSPDASG